MNTRFVAGTSASLWLLVTAAAPGEAQAQVYDSSGVVRFGIFGRWSSADFDVSQSGTTTTPFAVTAPDSPPVPASGTGSFDDGALGFSYGVDLVRNASWVLGIEGDISIEFAEEEIAGREYGPEFMSTLRGRVGSFVQPGWLVYATGGVAVLGVQFHGLRQVALTPGTATQRNEITDTLRTGQSSVGTEIEWAVQPSSASICWLTTRRGASATTPGAYSGGKPLGFTPSLVRALSKKGVFMAAGITLVTPIGQPSCLSSTRRVSRRPTTPCFAAQ